MNVESNVPLSSLTTLRAGGPATLVAHCTSVGDVRDALALAHSKNLPFYVLGEGSNVLASDEGYKGLIICIAIPGLSFEEKESQVIAYGGAGVSWDELVREAASRGLWGVENLAGIPGYLGAAPVQNIGAYGMDLQETLEYVDILDAETGMERRLTRDECMFEYRDSRFKREPNLIIIGVALALSRDGTPRIEYGDLLRAKEEGVDLATPESIGAAVRTIRSRKFPDRSLFGTAGSFFKNPVLTTNAYEALKEKYGDVPQFPNPNGVKIPLAFVLDRVLGLRGHRKGAAWLFGAQPLVLVLDANGNAADVEALAQEIEMRVYDATHIRIEREVRVLT